MGGVCSLPATQHMTLREKVAQAISTARYELDDKGEMGEDSRLADAAIAVFQSTISRIKSHHDDAPCSAKCVEKIWAELEAEVNHG
jgi:hypothetical protein